jgi:hypothetical protein
MVSPYHAWFVDIGWPRRGAAAALSGIGPAPARAARPSLIRSSAGPSSTTGAQAAAR